MSDTITGIEDIRERLFDFTDALREADSPARADEFEGFEARFTDVTDVRIAVADIRARLQAWRAGRLELPDSAKVELTANLLEDACSEALDAGVIVPAAPSLRAKATRKASVMLWTLLFGALLLLVPIGLISFGFDPDDAHVERVQAARNLPQGEETIVKVSALEMAGDREAVTGVEFAPLAGCRQGMGEGITCIEAEDRLWEDGRLPTFEVKRPNQAYGLQFSIGATEVKNGLGQLQLLVAATDRTPEGTYRIALEATYVGYDPGHCSLADRARKACVDPIAGPDARHRVNVPVVVIQVAKGDPSRRAGERRLEQAMAEEARSKAAERVAQIGNVLSGLQDALAVTDKAIRRKRWDEARDRLRKLSELFEPLDALTGDELDPEAIPEEVNRAQARLDALRDKQEAFETKVFELTFAALHASGDVDEEKAKARIAKRQRISQSYVDDVYTARADEIQRRLEAVSDKRQQDFEAHRSAVKERCGPLPQNSFQMAEAYLVQAHRKARLKMGECMSPRLREDSCWTFTCKYQVSVLMEIDKPRQVNNYQSTFHITKGRMVERREP